MKNTFKRYAMSTLITFVSGFAMALLAQYDQITWTTVTDGAVLGVLFSAFRAAFKLVLESLVQPTQV